MADFRGELRYHDLKGNDEFQLGGIAVKVRTIPHIGNTLGFRIEADGAVRGLPARPPGARRPARRCPPTCSSCATAPTC